MSLGFRPPTMIAPCRQSVRVTAAKQASPSDKAVLPGSKLIFAQSEIASQVKPGMRDNLMYKGCSSPPR